MTPRNDAGRAARIAAIVGGVVDAAVERAGAAGVVLLHDGSPEAELARGWCEAALGADRVWSVARPVAAVAGPLLDRASEIAGEPASADIGPDPAAIEEAHRFAARRLAVDRGALTVSAANKTALLLGARTAPEPLLPLGDLYARQVEALTGDWSAPAPVPELARSAGGIERLDGALAALIDERREPADAFAHLPDAAARTVRAALDRSRFVRRHAIGLVPKLGPRTLGIDLHA